jgi:hypothetical protein
LEVVKAYYQNYNSICLQELEKKNEKHQWEQMDSCLWFNPEPKYKCTQNS